MIIRGDIPSSKVYEDDMVLAFDDIKPAAPVHVVVIPKQHIPTLMDVKDSQTEYLHAMMAAIPKIARLKDIDESGFRIMLNCKHEGGQVVFHLHLHILGGKKLGCNPG
jgi:histidine triad (HIT) family protein